MFLVAQLISTLISKAIYLPPTIFINNYCKCGTLLSPDILHKCPISGNSTLCPEFNSEAIDTDVDSHNHFDLRQSD